VVDASVAAQLFVPEPLSAQANLLFSLLANAGSVFHVPDLFYAECANIFWKKVQRSVCSSTQAEQALADLLALPLQPTPTMTLSPDVLSLALTHGITAYDACYVALAKQLNVPLITADEKLSLKFVGQPLAVIWLGAWTPPAPAVP
jgi:predicted nucleic acid-binding protein